MKKTHRPCLFYFLRFAAGAILKQNAQPVNDRKFWLAQMDKVARPVLSSLAAGKLHENMPILFSPKVDNQANRAKVA